MPPAPHDPVPFLADSCPPVTPGLRDWKRVDPATLSYDELSALNYSPCTWSVTVQDGVPIPAPYQPISPEVPRGLQLPRTFGRPRAVRQGGPGTLVGFNRGEWGGTLLWYGSDGSFRSRLLDENVVQILALPSAILVFVGIAHLGDDHGRAVEIVESGQRFELKRAVDLGSAPRAAVPEPNGAVLVATMKGLVKLAPDFAVQSMLKADWGRLYPSTIVLGANQKAYIGMRGVIAEIDLSSSVVHDTWLFPPASR